MKTIKTFLMAVTVCALASCSNDDDVNTDNNNNPDEELVGTYELIAVIPPQEVDFNMDETASLNLMQETPCYDDSKIVLNSDHTYSYQLGNVLILEDTIECAEEVSSGVWEYDEETSVLTLTDEGEEPGVDPVLTLEYFVQGDNLSRTLPEYQYPSRDGETPVYATGTVTFRYAKL